MFRGLRDEATGPKRAEADRDLRHFSAQLRLSFNSGILRPMGTMKPLSPQDTAKLTLAVADRFKDKSMRPLLWVRDLHRAAEILASGGENCDTATTFWLRLFASLDELIPHYGWVLELFEGVVLPEQLTGDARLCADCHAALVALLDLFDENERVYIHYRRDTEGHVWQDSYELSRHQTKAKLIDERNYSLLGRKLAHDDVEKRLRSVIRRHRNALAIAVAFAQRAMPQIEDVVATIERMYVPAGADLSIV